MLKVVPVVLCLLACACGGHSDAPGLTIGDGDGDVDGEPSEVPGDGDDEPGPIVVPGDEDAGIVTPPEEDAGSIEEIPGSNVRFASTPDFEGYLTDAEGRALYIRRNDVATTDTTKMKTTCLGACADEWPPFNVEEIVAGRGFGDEDLKSFHRADAAWQISYKGHPLYYRASEAGATNVTGDAIDENGTQAYDGSAVWYVARNYQAFFYASTQVRPAGTALENRPFLTDGLGRTLYVYLTDTPGHVSASGRSIRRSSVKTWFCLRTSRQKTLPPSSAQTAPRKSPIGAGPFTISKPTTFRARSAATR
jgi:predicted lipoprotein with Yx(FWY)xxD motif